MTKSCLFNTITSRDERTHLKNRFQNGNHHNKIIKKEKLRPV